MHDGEISSGRVLFKSIHLIAYRVAYFYAGEGIKELASTGESFLVVVCFPTSKTNTASAYACLEWYVTSRSIVQPLADTGWIVSGAIWGDGKMAGLCL
jgi:hypothetical protein